MLDKDIGFLGVWSLASEPGIIERLIGGEVHLQTAKIVARGRREEKNIETMRK